MDWKKEIRLSDLLGRSSSGPLEEDAAPAEPKRSLWKKEISLRRRPQAEPPEAAAEEPAAEAVAAEPVQPAPKADISLPRVPHPPRAVRRAVPPDPDYDFLTRPLDEPALPPASPVVQFPTRPPVAAPKPAPAPEPKPKPESKPEPAPEPEPAAEDTTVVLPVRPDPPKPAPPPPAPAAGAPKPAPAPPPPAPVPAAEAPKPAPAPAAPPPPAPPPPAPAPAPPPPPPGIHPPVPAAELPPLEPEGEEKPKRFRLKRELSFPRRRKEAEAVEAPTAEPPAEQPDEAVAEKPRQPGTKKLPSRLVGLKVGGSQVAAARVANNGHAELLQVAREPLEPGVVVGGELRDPDALAEALKAFFKKHKLPKRGVRLGIANNRIGVRTFDVAGIEDPKQLANAIRFRAQEALPIPIEEAVLDYQILSETRTEEGELVCRVLLVVAYRDLVDRYVAACRKAGLGLVGIDLEAFALLRSLAAPGATFGGGRDAALVAVSIGHDRSTFAVSDGRACEFTRVLEWGGATLDVAVARALDLSPAEVEPFKRALSLAEASVPEGLTEEQATSAREAVRRQVQAFARELVSSLQFYQNQPGSLGIGEIVVTGGTAHLDGLAAELQRLIGVRVRVGDPLARVKVSKRVREPEQVGSLAVAIGLGIED